MTRCLPSCLPSRARRGVTMIEIVVATIIFALLIAMAFQISMFTTRSASETLIASNLEVKGERTLKLIVEALTASTRLDDSADGTEITFFSPVDIDRNGYTLASADNAIERGYDTGAGTGNGWMIFRFVEDASLRLTESAEDIDLNLDGDKNDSFARGWIQRFRVEDSNGNGVADAGELFSEDVVGVTNIVQRSGSGYQFGDSILNDSNPGSDTTGRIFYLPLGDTVIQINLWLMTISEDRFPHLIQCKGQVFLRNQ